jgi:hypothetical protein
VSAFVSPLWEAAKLEWFAFAVWSGVRDAVSDCAGGGTMDGGRATV